MNDDWAPGDLALCVDDAVHGPLPAPSGFRIKVGGLYRVASVDWINEAEELLGEGLCLSLEEDPDHLGWAWSCVSFTKIKPLSDEERREALEDIGIDGVVYHDVRA